MLLSTESTNSTQKSKELFLKPYSFTLSDKFLNRDAYHLENEYMDLKDFRNAAINELTLYNYFHRTNKTKAHLAQIFSNANIKILIIKGYIFSSQALYLLSYYLSINTTIKEIEIESGKDIIWQLYNNLQGISFIKAISSRITKIYYSPKAYDNIELYKLLFCSSANLNEIIINYKSYKSDEQDCMLKIIFSTKHYLDKLAFYPYKLDLNPEYFDYFKESDKNIEINTLILESNYSILIVLLLIKNAYLFKVETIEISANGKELIIEEILNLCNNPKNTVKRIIVNEKYEMDYIEAIKELLLTNQNNQTIQYNIQNLPKIFINGYEVFIEYNNSTNSYNVACPYYKSRDDGNDSFSFPYISKSNSFNLIFKDSLLDADNYTELLCLLFNMPTGITKLRIIYDENDIEVGNIDPQCLKDSTNSIINEMKELYHNYKANHIYSRKIELEDLNFYFDSKHPELNVFFFIVLEIMIDLKYKIKELNLNNCSCGDLADFLAKHKTLESLNIKIIFLHIDILDLENVGRLHQYSHLIKEKIKVVYDRLNKEDCLLSIYFQSIKNSNFVEFYSNKHEREQFIQFRNEIEISEFIEELKKEEIMISNKQRKKSKIKFRVSNPPDLIILCRFFSYYKENQIRIREIEFYFLENKSVDYIRNMQAMVLETILDVKFRIYSEEPIPTHNKCGKISKKTRRYFKLHNILE